LHLFCAKLPYSENMATVVHMYFQFGARSRILACVIHGMARKF
jgi:hypothetical protein